MIGGLLALFNPMSAAITATTLGGLALLFVAGLQGYSAWQTRELRGTVSSIIVSGSALLMAIILLWGPLGNGGLVRFVLCLLLFASGGVILWWGRSLNKDKVFPAIMASGAVPILLGLAVLFGFPAFIAGNFGIIVGLELIALGSALMLLALRRKKASVK